MRKTLVTLVISTHLIFSTQLFSQACPGNYDHVVIQEISGDAGQSDGCNDGFIELAGPPGTDIGCMVLSNAAWAVVLPSGTTIPADGIFLIACSEDVTSNCGAGLNGTSNGLACSECDFPNLPIDFDVCSASNAAYYDPGPSGFAIDNTSDTDGDAIVLFQPDGNIHDAVKWGGGANGPIDNCILQNGTYTLGDNDGNGVINDNANPASGASCAGGDVTGVPILPLGNCMLETFVMPQIDDPVYIDLSPTANGCNSSYIRLMSSTGASNNNPSHQTPDGQAIEWNDLIPSACDAGGATNQWAYTDHPNPGQANDAIAWAIKVDNEIVSGYDSICGSSTYTIILEIYNWQHVSDNEDTNAGEDNAFIGSYIIPPTSDSKRSLNADGLQAWDNYSRDDATGITTLTYVSGVLNTGEHPFILQWSDFTNCCGSTAPDSPNECYEREVLNVTVVGPISIDCGGALSTDCIISCSGNEPPAGIINVTNYVDGGAELTYILTDDSNTTEPDTNKTGIFEIPESNMSGPYTIRVIDGSECTYDEAVLEILENCEATLPCPQDLTNYGSSPDGTYCPGATIELCFDGDALPQNGQICWYQDADANFDPYAGEGELVGCVEISDAYPAPPDAMEDNIRNPLITEIHYNPAGPNDDNDSCAGEYIEIGGVPGTDVSCYMITDGDWVVTLPFGTLIPPDGFLLIGNTLCMDGPAHKVNIDINTCNCSTGEITLDNTGEFVAWYHPAGILLHGIIYGENIDPSNYPNGQTLTPLTPSSCTNGDLTLPVINPDNISILAPWGYTEVEVGDGESLSSNSDFFFNLTASFRYDINFISSQDILTADGTPIGNTAGEFNTILDTEVPCLTVTLEESYCSSDPIYFAPAFNPDPKMDCPADAFLSPKTTITLACMDADLVPISVEECNSSDGSIANVEVNFLSGTAPYELTYLIADQDGSITTTITTTDNPYSIEVAGPTNGETQVRLVSVIDSDGASCSGKVDTDEATINIRPAPTGTISTHTDITGCNATNNGMVTFNFTGTGPFDFEYSIDGGTPILITTVNHVYVLNTPTAGTYDILSVGDALGCPGVITSNPQMVETIADAPVINAVTGPAAICNDGSNAVNLTTDVSIDATPTGGSVTWYLISPDDPTFNASIHELLDPTSVAPTSNANFFFSYLDPVSGCAVIGIVLVEANASLCCQAPTITCPANDLGLAAACNPSVPAAQTMFNTDPSDTSNPALPTVENGCGTVVLTATDETVDVGCTRTVTRTYRATDENDDFVECQQTFTFTVDSNTPIFNESLPIDATVSCASIPAAATLTAADNCTTNIMVSFTETTTAGVCADTYVLTRTWTATDECGNENIHTQTITVADTSAPVFNESLPIDVTVSCASIPSAVTLTAADNCTTNIMVSFMETTIAGVCAHTYVLTRTWTATDECGNENMHTQTITVEDNSAPIFNESLPIDATVSCTSIPAAVTLTAADNCTTNIMVSFTETTTAGICADTYVLTRRWTATDECGNENIHTQTITVADNTNPFFNETILPVDQNVNCNASIPIAATLTASDNCDMDIPVVFVETSIAGTCPQEEMITRTWTIEDACGNRIQHQQILTIIDNVMPVFSEPLPLDEMVSCDVIPAAVTLTATDNCDPNILVVFLEESMTNGNCPQEVILTRTWTATDACGNANVHTQMITINDDTNPSFDQTVLPMDATVECDAIPMAAVLTASDNCDSSVEVVFAEASVSSLICAQREMITRTWTIEDACGNRIQHQQVIRVQDNSMPVFNENLPMDVTVSCDAIPTAMTLTATDICDGNMAVIFVETNNTTVTCPQKEIITRTWTVEDACGNRNMHTQILTVEDNTNPFFNETDLPLDVTVECGAIPIAAVLTASDNCDSSVEVVFAEASNTTVTCPQKEIITRTWTIEDACGNSHNHVQLITVEDNVNPFFNETSLPLDVTVECGAIPIAAVLTASDNCDATINVDFAEVNNTMVTCPQKEIITRTWTIEDACGNSHNHVQVITVQDTNAPIFDQAILPSTVNLDCTASIPTAETLTVSDDCDGNSIPVIFNETTIPSSNCPQEMTISRMWIATDACGNVASHNQLINIIDGTAPLIVCPPSIEIGLGLDQCEQVVTFDPVTATDNCGAIPVIQQIDPNGLVSGDVFYAGTTTLMYTAEDACGNVSNCEFDIVLNTFSNPNVNLICLSTVNVSLDLDCEATMTANTFLSGNNYGCLDLFEVVVSEGIAPNLTTIPTSPLVNGDYVGQNLTVTITDPTTGSSCTSMILIEDKIAPEITCEDVVLDCDANTDPIAGPAIAGVLAAYEPVVNEPCGEYTLIHEDVMTEGTCSDVFATQIRRTWTVTNEAGMSSTCVQTIQLNRATISDFSGPVNFDNLQEPAFNCSDFPDNPDLIPDEDGYLTASRTCFAETHTLPLDIAAGASTSINFTTENIPTTAEMVATIITKVDNGNALVYTLTSPSGTTMNISNPNFMTAFEGENPSGIWVLNVTNNGGEASIAELSLLLDFRINTRPIGPQCANMIFGYNDTYIPLCGSSYKILRVWQVLDWCDNSVIQNFSQVYAVMDTKAPLIVCPTAQIVTTDFDVCTTNFDVLAPSLSDDCSATADLIYTPSNSSGNLAELVSGGYIITEAEVGDHIITYTAADECGNTSQCNWIVTVRDQVSPTVVCETRRTISLINTPNGQASVLFANSLDDGSTDNCGPVTFAARRMDNINCPEDDETDFADSVPFTCCDNGSVVMVEFQVTDESGNANTCMSEVTVMDAVAPNVTCPANKDIVCLDALPVIAEDLSTNSETGLVPVYKVTTIVNGMTTYSDDVIELLGYYAIADNCGANIYIQESGSLSNCGVGVLERTWQAEDVAGNIGSACVQTITVTNGDPFVIVDLEPSCTAFTTGDNAQNPQGPHSQFDDVEWPCDVVISCTDPLDNLDTMNTGRPILNESICDQITLDYEDANSTVIGSECQLILREWIVTDLCQFQIVNGTPVAGYWTYTQRIEVNDTNDPVLTSCTDLAPVFANNTSCTGIVMLEGSATDICTDDDLLNWSYQIDFDNNGQGPFATGTTNNATNNYPIGEHKITWTVEDNCGNKTSCDQVFSVVDGTVPSFIPISFATVGLVPQVSGNGIGTLSGVDLVTSSFDACSMPLEFVIQKPALVNNLGSPPTTASAFATFDCDDRPFVNVDLWGRDQAGNWDYITLQVNVDDSNPQACMEAPGLGIVSGEVYTETNEMIEQVTVHIDGNASEMPLSVVTNEEAYFEFSVPLGANYLITPEREDYPLNGISTYDLILMSRHILGIEQLDSPYKMIAADINKSGTITAFDLVELRKLILFINDEFEENNSWRFVDANYVFSNPENPFESTFPEVTSFNGITQNESSDFIGVKIGDLNNSVVPNALIDADYRNAEEELIFEIEDQDLVAEQTYQIDVKMKEERVLLGYQFTLQMDPAVFSSIEMESGNSITLTKENFGYTYIDNGVITSSWNKNEAQKVGANETLFTMSIKAKESTRLSDVLQLNSSYTPAEAYDEHFEQMEVRLDFKQDKNDFALFQNRPNPFKEETVIGFYLPKATPAKLSIYDLSGRLIKIIDQEYEQGYQELTIHQADVEDMPVLYYRLETPDYTASRKMIFIK